MQQNIFSQFKYTMELGVKATKTTFKLKRTKKDIITHILVVVFIFVMSGILTWDILRDNSFVLDLIILVALVGVEIFNLIMPAIIIHTQKKFLKQLNLAEIDHTITEIKQDKCTETYYKNNKIVMQNVCDMSKVSAYKIEGCYAFVVFNNFACAIFDLNTLNVTCEELIQALDSAIAQNKPMKNKR